MAAELGSPTNLRTAIAAIDAQLADITASAKPSYSLDGKSVSWGEHFNNLLAAREKLVALLIQAEGPHESRIVGVP